MKEETREKLKARKREVEILRLDAMGEEEATREMVNCIEAGSPLFWEVYGDLCRMLGLQLEAERARREMGKAFDALNRKRYIRPLNEEWY